MGNRGPQPETGEARSNISIRIAPGEQAMIERARAARGDDYAVETMRAAPQLWVERQHLMRAGLHLLRGQLTAGEVGCILDVMNGTHILAGISVDDGLPDMQLVGTHVVANVADSPDAGERWGCDVAALAARLYAAPLVARAALELWCGWLWTRHKDEDLWARERAWLATP